MKSFSESLKITKNMNLAKQCFALMAENGIDPERYVEWYCDFGVIYQESGVLLEGSMKWLKTESLLVEAGWMGAVKDAAGAVGNYFSPTAMGNYAQKAGQAVAGAKQFANQVGQTAGNMQDKFQQGMGQPQFWRQAQAAEQALNQLHRRIGVSPQLLQAVGGQGFMQTILQMIETLKNPKQIAAPTATPMPPEDSTTDAWRNHTESVRLKNDIKAGLRSLQSFGYDPVEFVEWFEKEIQNLNEGLWDSAGEWLGNQWANTMGTANRWLTGGQKQAWGHDAKNRVQKKDSEAITAALKALNQLNSVGNINPEFKATLDNVLKGLQTDPVKQYMSGTPAPEAAPEGETAPEGEAPETAPEGEALPDNGMGGNTAELANAPAWAGQLPQGLPDDPANVQAAMNIFNTLPDDQKQEIDQNARRVWVRKGKPSQDQAGMDLDKSRAMYAMSQRLDMSKLPTEWFQQDDLRFIESICGSTKSWFN